MTQILYSLFRWLVSSEVISSILRNGLRFLLGVGIFAVSLSSIPAFFSATTLAQHFTDLLSSTRYGPVIHYALNLIQLNYGISVVISAYITAYTVNRASKLIK